MPHEKVVGKPYAGEPHVRIEKGAEETGRGSDTAPRLY